MGEAVTLDGTIEVVLEPDLFSTFHYDPKIGDTFDFVTSGVGITLAQGLQYQFFVTAADASYLKGFDLVSYSSGIADGPDILDQIIDPGLFSFRPDRQGKGAAGNPGTVPLRHGRPRAFHMGHVAGRLRAGLGYAGGRRSRNRPAAVAD